MGNKGSRRRGRQRLELIFLASVTPITDCLDDNPLCVCFHSSSSSIDTCTFHLSSHSLGIPIKELLLKLKVVHKFLTRENWSYYKFTDRIIRLDERPISGVLKAVLQCSSRLCLWSPRDLAVRTNSLMFVRYYKR